MTFSIETCSARIVAASLPTSDVNILKGEVRATAGSTENVVVVSIRVHSSRDIDEADV